MIKAKKLVITIFTLLKNALAELLKNDPLRMAGATAFFTTFALPPILVIMIQLLKLVLDPEKIRVEIFKSLSNILGPEAGDQLNAVLMAFRKLAQNWYVTLGGFIFLLFVATTLFKIIESSVNQIWKIKPLVLKGIFNSLRTRFHSILVIIGAGVLFVIGMLAETMQIFIGKYILEFSPLLSAYFNGIAHYIASMLVVIIWFVLLFRYLPDGRPSWSVAWAGGIVTGILFTLGKIILHWLLTYSNINTLYGTSASIVLLLLFVFYASLILYYGAAFTKIWAIHKGCPIKPLSHAMHYKLIETEMETQ